MKNIIILLFAFSLFVGAQTYKSGSLQIVPGEIVTTDTIIKLTDRDVAGMDWSFTIESDACDSFIFAPGGSLYQINETTHVFDFDLIEKDTFVRAANLDTINGVAIETKSYYGTNYPFSVPHLRYYKHATASDTINVKWNFHR